MSRFQFCLLAAVVSVAMSGCCWGGWGRSACGGCGGCGTAYGYQGYGQTAFAAPAYGAPGGCGCQ